MKGTLRIGRVGGVPISVHWSFSFLILLVILSDLGAPSSAVFWLLLWIVALFASVTFHELSHCAVARHLGLKVEGIVLLPVGGVSQISGLPGPPDVELKVAGAGPLSSIGLAAIFALFGLVSGVRLWPPTLFAGSWLSRLAWLNLLLAAFNLLPALPMDGGRVFRAILARRRGEPEATRIAAVVAQMLAVAMILLGFLVDLWLMIIGLLVFVGASGERQSARVQQSLGGLRVGDVMASDATTVPAAVRVAELGGWLASFPGRALPVAEGGHVVGIVSMVDLIGKPWDAPVGSVCDRAAPMFDPSTPLYPGTLEMLSRYSREAFAVVVGGNAVGVLYCSTVKGILDRDRAIGQRQARQTAA